MLTVFNFTNFWRLRHNLEQTNLFNHIKFFSIRGFGNLYVADVSEEEKVMLVLIGLSLDNTIATVDEYLSPDNKKNRVLHKDKDEYCIIEVYSSTIENKS